MHWYQWYGQLVSAFNYITVTLISNYISTTHGKSTPTEHPQIASKVTEIGRISIVMYVSDHIVHRKLQFTL